MGDKLAAEVEFAAMVVETHGMKPASIRPQQSIADERPCWPDDVRDRSLLRGLRHRWKLGAANPADLRMWWSTEITEILGAGNVVHYPSSYLGEPAAARRL